MVGMFQKRSGQIKSKEPSDEIDPCVKWEQYQKLEERNEFKKSRIGRIDNEQQQWL